MGLLGEMTVKLGVNTSSFTSGLGGAGNALKSFASSATALNPVVGIITTLSAAAVGFGVQSVQTAADFQQSMLKIAAYAGLSKQQIDSMSDSILQMATKVGQSPKALADALYPIISSGYSASQALQILQLSAETAAASGAKTSVVADALTTSLKAMHAPASQAGLYMDYLNKMVSLGKGEVPQYAAVLGKLALSAGSANVPFADMGAALATLTTHGFPSVAQASTALGNLFTQVGPKVDTMAQHAKQMGITFDEGAFKTMSLSDKVAYLNQVTGGNQGEILKLLNGNTLALKSFNSLNGSVGDYTSNLKSMQSAHGATQAAFEKASSGFNASMARVHASIDVLKVKVGSALLPALTGIMDKVAPLIARFTDWESKNHIVEKAIGGVSTAIQNTVGFVTNLVTGIQNLTNFFQKNHDAAALLAIPLGILGGIMTYLAVTAIIDLIAALPAMITGFLVGAAAAWTMAAGVIAATWPFLLIGAAIGIVVALVILAINHWGEITKWLQSVWGAFSKWFMGLWNGLVAWITGLLGGIGAFFQQAWAFIVGLVQAAGQAILNAIMAPFIAIGAAFIWLYGHNTYVKALVDAVIGFFTGLRDKAIAIISYVTQWLNAQWAALQVRAQILWRQISDAITGPINQAKAFAINAVNTAHQFISDKWSQLSKLASDAWGKVSSVFSSAWNTYIAKPLGDLWKRVSDWWNNTVIGGMRSLGGNMMHAIADGVMGAGGAVGDAIHNAIGSALANLGFHDIPGWTLPGHAKGILNSPTGHWAMVGENGPEMMYVPQGSSIYPNSYTSSSNAGSSDSGTQHIIVQLDGDVLMQAMGSRTAKQIRLTHGRRVA